MRISKRVSALATIIASSALAVPGAATAATGQSFNGNCIIPGNTVYASDGLEFNGAGTCRGSVDGGPTATYQASNVVNEQGTVLSTGIGPSLPGVLTGTGSLTLSGAGLDSPATIEFTIDQVGTCFTSEGSAGGIATGCGVPTNAAGTALTVYVTTLGTQHG
jgi:hypothetical protein